jgi:hypothetical protein
MRLQAPILSGNLPVLADRRKRSVPEKKTDVAKVTLYLVAAFSNPWKGHPKEELSKVDRDPDKSKWHPTEDDWIASVEGKPTTTVRSFTDFLQEIHKQKDQSVERINVFSHGRSDLIGFAGEVTRATGECFINTANAGGLDEKTLLFNNWKPLGNGKYEKPAAVQAYELRGKFVQGGDAEICFYLCNAGTMKSLMLQQVADVFGVKVRGFDEEIVYWVDPGPKGAILRGFTSLKSEGYDRRQKGIAHLYKKFVTRDPKPLDKRSLEMLTP